MDEFLPLRDVVFNTLRKAILTGELKPGERLMEIHLANRLGGSRTPIREAIRKLEQMYRYRFEYIKDENRHDSLVNEHRIIYQSIVSGDKKRAAETARLHIDNQEKSIIRQIRLEQEQAARKK